jgi:hypothetical protein
MDRMVARLNIDHFENLLKTATNEAERERLRGLLAEEREKLRKAELDHRKKEKRD